MNYGPRAKSDRPLVFTNRVVLGRSRLICLRVGMAAVELPWRSSVVATETTWPAKSEAFTLHKRRFAGSWNRVSQAFLPVSSLAQCTGDSQVRARGVPAV